MKRSLVSCLFAVSLATVGCKVGSMNVDAKSQGSLDNSGGQQGQQGQQCQPGQQGQQGQQCQPGQQGQQNQQGQQEQQGQQQQPQGQQEQQGQQQQQQGQQQQQMAPAVGTFNMVHWHPTCIFGGACWHDHINQSGMTGRAYLIRYDSGDYAAKTNGELTFVCRSGARTVVRIPGEISVGWQTEWINNPCPGELIKITTKAGLNGTWGRGVLAYYEAR